MRRFCEFSESFGLARDSLSRWRWTRELVPPLSQPPSRPFIPPQLAGIKEVGKTKERRGYLAKQIVAFCARCREFKSFARAASLFTRCPPPPSLLPLPPLYTCLPSYSSRPPLVSLSFVCLSRRLLPSSLPRRILIESNSIHGSLAVLPFPFISVPCLVKGHNAIYAENRVIDRDGVSH